jgi:hypothetical protein
VCFEDYLSFGYDDKSLDETVIVYRSSKYFNTLSREHVTGEMMSNIYKVKIGVEEMVCVFKQMVCRGPLNEDLCLTDIKIEVSNFFENGRQHGDELEGCRDDVPIVDVIQDFDFNSWKFLKNGLRKLIKNRPLNRVWLAG